MILKGLTKQLESYFAENVHLYVQTNMMSEISSSRKIPLKEVLKRFKQIKKKIISHRGSVARRNQKATNKFWYQGLLSNLLR